MSKENLLQEFNSKISQLAISKAYGQLIAELRQASSRADLDENTRRVLEEKIAQVEQMMRGSAAAQKSESTATTNGGAAPKQASESSEREEIKRKIEKFKKARNKLFSAINENLHNRKIVAVNSAGIEEELVIDMAAGIPAHIVGFAGEDPAALQEVAQEMDNFCEAIPPQMGLEVKKVAIVDQEGRENRFFAIILPENHNERLDPFTMSNSEIEGAFKHAAAIVPSSKPVSAANDANNESLAEQSLSAFKNRIARAFSVFNGSAEELDKFHQQQIISLWKEHVKDSKLGKMLGATKLENSRVSDQRY